VGGKRGAKRWAAGTWIERKSRLRKKERIVVSIRKNRLTAWGGKVEKRHQFWGSSERSVAHHKKTRISFQTALKKARSPFRGRRRYKRKRGGERSATETKVEREPILAVKNAERGIGEGILKKISQRSEQGEKPMQVSSWANTSNRTGFQSDKSLTERDPSSREWKSAFRYVKKGGNLL